jgi:hypothetical protein
VFQHNLYNINLEIFFFLHIYFSFCFLVFEIQKTHFLGLAKF